MNYLIDFLPTKLRSHLSCVKMGEKISRTPTASKKNISNGKSSTISPKNGKIHQNGNINNTCTNEEIEKEPYYDLPEQKSVVVAYILWLFGGIFGIHHLYLHRDRHAFVWWCTLGGYFGIGWIAEVFQIPRLVKDANEDSQFIAEFRAKIALNRKPPFSTWRFVGALTVGYLWGQVVMIAIPEEVYVGVDWSFLHWFIPLGCALGVWTVGNIGREKGVLWHCLLGSYVCYLSRYFVFDEAYWFTGMAFGSAMAFDLFSKEWNLDVPKRHGKKRRTAILVTAVVIYLSLWCCYFYFNGKITDADGDEVPVHEAIRNFIKSPWWTDIKQTLHDTYQFAQHNGWYETWKQIVDTIDADGEQNSYKVLGVSPTASQTEITSVWRKLSREHHPDKVKDDSLRRAAQERFMEIQQAYEVLSKIKAKRRSKNKKYSEEL